MKSEQSLTKRIVPGKAKLFAKAGPVEIQLLKLDHQKNVFFRCQTVSLYTLHLQDASKIAVRSEEKPG